MIFPTLSLDYKGIIAASIIGAVAVWVAKKGLEKAVEKTAEVVKENTKYVNPANESNLAFQGFDFNYKLLTGSEDTLGEDIADGIGMVKGWFGN